LQHRWEALATGECDQRRLVWSDFPLTGQFLRLAVCAGRYFDDLGWNLLNLGVSVGLELGVVPGQLLAGNGFVLHHYLVVGTSALGIHLLWRFARSGQREQLVCVSWRARDLLSG